MKSVFAAWLLIMAPVICLYSPALLAAPKGGVAAVVRGENVQVYSAPDFDSKVIGRFRTGARIRVSRGTTGNYYKFHKVIVGKRAGYVADNEVAVGDRAIASTSPAEKTRRRKTKSVYFSRFVGALVGTTEFKESISGVDASDQLLIYGLKITGPDMLFAAAVVDLNIALHYGAPKYYNKLSAVGPSGFVLYTDALLLLPWLQRQNFAGLFGIGPLLVYSDFNVVNNSRAQSLSTLNIGASLMAGGVYRIGSVGLRLEGKYFLEKQYSKALQFSLQTEW